MSLLAKLIAESHVGKTVAPAASGSRCRVCHGVGRVLPYFSANHMTWCKHCGGTGKER